MCSSFTSLPLRLVLPHTDPEPESVFSSTRRPVRCLKADFVLLPHPKFSLL